MLPDFLTKVTPKKVDKESVTVIMTAIFRDYKRRNSHGKYFSG